MSPWISPLTCGFIIIKLFLGFSIKNIDYINTSLITKSFSVETYSFQMVKIHLISIFGVLLPEINFLVSYKLK